MATIQRTEQRPIVTGGVQDSSSLTFSFHYQTLKAEVFQPLARHVGYRLSQLTNDARYGDQRIVNGLAHFLQVVSELLVSQPNRDRCARRT